MKGRQRVGEAIICYVFQLPRVQRTRVEMPLFLFVTLAPICGRTCHEASVASRWTWGYLDLMIELSAPCPRPLSKTREWLR